MKCTKYLLLSYAPNITDLFLLLYGTLNDSKDSRSKVLCFIIKQLMSYKVFKVLTFSTICICNINNIAVNSQVKWNICVKLSLFESEHRYQNLLIK